MREQIIKKVLENKLIAIVRGVYGEDALHLARALHSGGIDMIEFTFNQKLNEDAKRTQEAIYAVNKEFGGEVLAGAGTVTTEKHVDLAYEAGAKYIISPNVNAPVIKRTLELGMVSIPGAMTPSEILEAHTLGADFVKLFPAATMGIAYFKAILAPINHVRMLVVGGVNLENLASYMNAGAVGAGVGGNLVNKQWIAEGRFEDITDLARKMTAAAKG